MNDPWYLSVCITPIAGFIGAVALAYLIVAAAKFVVDLSDERDE